MFTDHVTYRFENGALQQFVGTGITPRNARQNGVDQIKAAVAARAGETFSMTRIGHPECAAAARQTNAVISTRIYVAALG
jgi:hypothetical protein